MPRLEPLAALCSVIVACIACGPQVSAPPASTETAGSTATTTTTSSTTSVVTTNTTSTFSTTDAAPPTSTGAEETANFTMMPDLPPPVACDPWNDTCPRGQKCKPYDKDGGWKAVCAELDEQPSGVGEACDEGEVNAFDDCPEGTMCYGFWTGQKGLRCTPLCEGTPDDSSCADVCSGCLKYQDGLFGVCPVRCNPLTGDCPEGLACTVYVGEPRLFCYPPSKSLGPGEPCEGPFDCGPGTACLWKDMLPSCAGESCCTPVCDLTLPDSCGTAYPETVCAPWPTVNPDFHAECLPPGLGLCMADL